MFCLTLHPVERCGLKKQSSWLPKVHPANKKETLSDSMDYIVVDWCPSGSGEISIP